MEQETQKETSKKLWTLPNILTMIRILLIPVFIWVSLGLKKDLLALLIMVLSYITDVLDGFIARHWNLVSEFGKFMDPVADKLNQATILFVLIFKYPIMAIPLGIMIIKELYLGYLMILVIKRSGRVYQAEWHGKIATFCIYLTMALHLIWPDRMPDLWSYLTVGITVSCQLVSLVLYAIRNSRLARQFKDHPEEPSEK